MSVYQLPMHRVITTALGILALSYFIIFWIPQEFSKSGQPRQYKKMLFSTASMTTFSLSSVFLIYWLFRQVYLYKSGGTLTKEKKQRTSHGLVYTLL